MKKKNSFWTFIVLFCLCFQSYSQTLDLTGPSSVSYCDLSSVNFHAYAPYTDDHFDKVDWKYEFSLWSNGVQLISTTKEDVAVWDIGYNDYAFESGQYQVKLVVKYKFGYVWITSTTLWSNGINLNLFGTLGEYDASKTDYRMVSGDFDNDGKEDDIAAFYNYGSNNTALHVWKSNGSYLEYQGDNGWWYGNSFDALKVSGRVVSGDFDSDGKKDDIAAIYDYGNNHSIIHVWKSNGTTFNYAGQWWTSGYGANGYNATKVTGRVVSGDFDRDGFEDDICMMYDYGGFSTSAHVFTSTGSSFGFAGTWYSSGAGNFEAGKISHKFVSGDFDRDGYKDDISCFYAYSGNQTKNFVWNSTGSTFSSPQTWYDSGSGNFDGNKITGRVVSGDFDQDGYKDDITAYYDYGGSLTQAFVWKSTGLGFSWPTSWYNSGAGNFTASKITGKLVAGDFDNNGKIGDVSGLYDYGGLSTRYFLWKAQANSFMAPITSWEICYLSGRPSAEEQDNNFSEVDEANVKMPVLNIFPNPAKEIFTLQLENHPSSNMNILTMDGKIVFSKNDLKNGFYKIDISNFSEGVYFISIYNDYGSSTRKLIISK